MLEITFNTGEQYNEEANEFLQGKTYTLKLEHSLVSLSKWESKWQKPFLINTDGQSQSRKQEEVIDYIRCMTITQNVDDEVYRLIPRNKLKEIMDYIESPQTATVVREIQKTGGRREVVTSEIIYYWMVSIGIPFECQKWHLNRLLTLIRVCNIKNNGQKNKLSKRDTMSHNRELNAKRRRALNSKG